MDPRTALLEAIAEAEQRLKSYKEALKVLNRSQLPKGTPTTRFYGWRPLKAFKQLIEEHGGRMERQALLDAAMAGGIAIDRKRSIHNVRISLLKCLEIESLLEAEGLIRVNPEPPKRARKTS
jgi:hypothetical protein